MNLTEVLTQALQDNKTLLSRLNQDMCNTCPDKGDCPFCDIDYVRRDAQRMMERIELILS